MKLHAALVGAINEGLMPRFRTKIEDLLTKMPEKGSGEQIAAFLRNNGVSDHEIKWTKLDGLLKQPKLTKDEIVNHLAEHGLPFKTMDHYDTLNGHKYDSYALKGGKPDSYGEKIFQLNPSERKPWKLEWDVVKPEYGDVDFQVNGHKPGADRSGKYNAPDLPTAEVLSKTDKDGKHNITARVRDENYYGRGGNRYESRSKWVTVYSATCSSDEQKAKCIEAAKEACGQKLADNDARDNSDEQDYKSQHWDGSNQLFHVRHQEFDDADGKSLWLIEEIQSDWHQQGRKKGYRGESKAEVKHNPEHTDGFNYEVHIDGNRVSRHKDEESAKTSATSTEKSWTGNRVPNAPMKKTWEEMAFKWALHQAVQAGAERIGWITGEIAADRFDISKQVDHIRLVYTKEKYPNANAPTMSVYGYKDGQTVVNKGISKEDELSDVLGKDVARKILDQPKNNYERELKGTALKVGGEGMKAAYDQRIVSIAKKIAKITGAMVGKVLLPDAEDEGEEVDPYEAMDLGVEQDEDDGKWYVRFDGEETENGGPFDSQEEADAARERMVTIREAKTGHEVWYMDINEKTKAMVNAGMRATFESVKPKTVKPWWIV